MAVQLLKHDMNSLEGEKNQLSMDIEDKKKIEEDKIRPIILRLDEENEKLRIDTKDNKTRT